MDKKNYKRKLGSIFEVMTLIISSIAFAFIMGGMTVGIIPKVAAETLIPQGCCVEANDGSKCTDMNLLDAASCKNDLVATGCEYVDDCRKGCCYDSSLGTCSLNSPKSSCANLGGNWTNNPTCAIAQCQLGCCVLGDQASVTTTRECTLLSKEYGFDKQFTSLDDDGSCSSKIGLEDEGACVLPSDDFSGENQCKFTTKKSCQGEFHKDFLCTAESLKTTCNKMQNTSCFDGKDQVYYVDSCGNRANVYDAEKYEEDSYWEKVVSPSESCEKTGKDCGNCDYMNGDICRAYDSKKDTKPTYGNNVCRNLNCKTAGKKHGESWCIYDFPPKSGIMPVGSRNFIASCLDGEVSLSGCADFNQEICVQAKASNGFTESKCVVNDWRSCLAANEKESYQLVKTECDNYPQCIMFNDFYGEENLKRSDDALFTGFKTDISNSQQGSSGEVGKNSNSVIAHCVPRYTPGFQFWNSISANNSASSSSNKESNSNYGGGVAEANAICSIGKFTCVSKVQRKCELTGSGLDSSFICVLSGGISSLTSKECDDWYDVDNWECNIDGVTSTIKTEDLPKYLAALNERCRAIGTCGVSSNIAGEINSNNSGFTITRAIIDAKGKMRNLTNTEKYVLSEDYLASITKSINKIGKFSDLTQTGNIGTNGASVEGGGSLDSLEAISVGDVTSSIKKYDDSTMGTIASSLGAIGIMSFSSVWETATFATSANNLLVAGSSGANSVWSIADFYGGLGTAIGAAIGMAAGYLIGNLVIKNNNWSPGRTRQFMEAIMAVGGAIGATIAAVIMIVSSSCGTGVPVACIVGIVVAALYAVYEACIDNKYKENQYYILEYNCEAWEPPKQGNCDLCNNDVRPCSEYRCRSLGMNCKYYNTNGEPGYCASGEDVNSPVIKPWKPGFTEGFKPDEVNNRGFKIVANNGETIPAFTTVQFGIETNEYATCKIDNKRTPNYVAMAVDMTLEQDFAFTETATIGKHHTVALSPYITGNNSGESTLALNKESENNYYIRCKDSAGNINEAEFAVRVIVGEGEDLTPPIILSFSPESGSYVRVGQNSTSVAFFVNEPSKCKYSQATDNRYEDMTQIANCMTNEAAASLGKWPCYATLTGLTTGENKFYFQCEDKPEVINNPNETAKRTNINRNSKQYSVNVCSTGLNITKLEPNNTIITGSNPLSVTITAETSGCIAGGKATCSYSLNNYNYITLFNTDSTEHSQTFDNIVSGNYTVNLKCEDAAGNTDTRNTSFIIDLDSQSPNIIRSYTVNQKLTIATNEDAECRYTNSNTLGCTFEYDSNANVSTMEGNENVHSAPYEMNKDYYIKCRDIYNNTNSDCGIIIRTY